MLIYIKLSVSNMKLLDCIVDSIPYKQGRYTPGTHIPIHPELWLEKNKPDYALLLSWNFADEILNKKGINVNREKIIVTYESRL